MIKKELKIVYSIICFLALAFVLGILLYRHFVNNDLFPSLSTKSAVSLCVALIVAVIKLLTRSYSGIKKSLNYYKDFYKDIIKNSFEENKNLQHKFLQAVSFYNNDKFNKSIKYLNSILPECKTINEKYCVKLFLALNYTDCGNSEDAIGIYEDMIDESIADSTVYSNLMLLHKDNGDFNKADEIGKKAILYDPKNYTAYNNLASSSFHNGDYEQAIEYAKKCIEIKNDFLPSIKLLYLIYSLEEDFQQAELYARKAIANGVSKKELEEALEYYKGQE